MWQVNIEMIGPCEDTHHYNGVAAILDGNFCRTVTSLVPTSESTNENQQLKARLGLVRSYK